MSAESLSPQSLSYSGFFLVYSVTAWNFDSVLFDQALQYHVSLVVLKHFVHQLHFLLAQVAAKMSTVHAKASV